jgi:hypothetical protein
MNCNNKVCFSIHFFEKIKLKTYNGRELFLPPSRLLNGKSQEGIRKEMISGEMIADKL